MHFFNDKLFELAHGGCKSVSSLTSALRELQKLAAEQEGHMRRLTAAYEGWPGGRGHRQGDGHSQRPPQQREGGRMPPQEDRSRFLRDRSRPTSAPLRRKQHPPAHPHPQHQQVGSCLSSVLLRVTTLSMFHMKHVCSTDV